MYGLSFRLILSKLNKMLGQSDQPCQLELPLENLIGLY